MNNARQEIFDAIRRNKIGGDAESFATTQHIVPQRTQLTDQQSIELFEKMVIESAATITTVSAVQEAPQVVRQYIGTLPVAPGSLFVNCPAVAEFDWNETGLEIVTDKSGFKNDISVTQAYCGIAETGSVVLLAEPGVSSAAYFLPDILIVLVQKKKIFATQERCWRELRSLNQQLPRTVTLVTGPSRTGDIEQKLVIGAHGPRKLHVIVIDD